VTSTGEKIAPVDLEMQFPPIRHLSRSMPLVRMPFHQLCRCTESVLLGTVSANAGVGCHGSEQFKIPRCYRRGVEACA
jgi:hypothetical protein